MRGAHGLGLLFAVAFGGCTDELPAALREAARRATQLEGISGARRVIDVALPPQADGVVRVVDRTSAVAVDVRLAGARPVAGRVVEEWMAYPRGHALGTLYQRVTDEGTEDFLWLEQAPAQPRLVYEMRPGPLVAGLRLVDDSLELLDRSGVPRLRVPPPWVQGADGARRAAHLALEGCAVDRDGRPPYGRAPIPPGADRCSLVVSWSSEGLALPALVDPAWVSTANMITARHSHTTTSLADDRVLVVGGMTPTGETNKVEIYDPRSETWSGVTPISGARQGHTATRLTTSGDVLVVGGHVGTTRLADVQRYSGGSWISDLSIPGARTWHTSTLIDVDEVLIAGGYDGVALDSSHKYFAGGWSSGGTLGEARYQHTATLLPVSGRVLLVGGQGTSAALASAERSNPAVTGWSTIAPLIDGIGRLQHTATLMPLSGKVMVAGGYNESGTYPATAYLYAPEDGPTGTWYDAGTLPTGGRRAHVAALLNTAKVLSAGGVIAGGSYPASYLTFEEPSTWTTVPSGGPMRSFAGAVTLPLGTVLVVGGNGSAGAEKTSSLYNPSTSTTSLTASTTARADHTATELADKRIFVYGGQVAGTAVALPRIYDPVTTSWSTVTSPFFATVRKRHTATLLDDGRVLMTGGDAGGAPTTSSNYYNPTTWTFSPGPVMTAARAGHAAVKLPGGKVLITGGDGPLASAETWDPATGTFTALATSMSVGRKDHTASLLSNGTALIAGGDAATPSTSEVYDGLTWGTPAAMTGQRFGHQAVVLTGLVDDVLAIGGTLSGGTTILGSVDRYVVATNTWTAATPMFAPRRRHGAVRLKDGRVLVAGGDNNNALAGTEVFDPTANSWSVGAQLQVARAGHTATLLSNSGRVLIALGAGPGGALSQCELYVP